MTRQDAETWLEVSSLVGGYGRVPVVHGIDLSVAAGEVVGVLGHNGMGKSTLLKLIMGMLPARSGRVRFRGADVTADPPHRRALSGMGYVPQGRGIFPQLSVRDNLRFAWQDHGGDDEMAAMDRVLADFPRLSALIDREGSTLSGGEQQLLALARCLMGAPDLLLLDEPTEGIQPSIIDEIAQTLGHLRDAQGLSILLVEQNFDFIAALSDRVLVLERGQITGALSRADLADAAKVDAFLGFGAARSTRVRAHPAPGSADLTARAAPTSPATPPSRRSAAHHPPAVRPTPHQPPAAPATTMPQVSPMTVKRPSHAQMRAMADRFSMSMSDDELGQFAAVMEGYIQTYDRVNAAPDNLPISRYPRNSGYRPGPSENPLNAWYYKTEVHGAVDGPLRGKRIVLKDNVALAGVPMMNGSAILEGYTPEIDATVVTRLLDAGAVIVGKAHCENFCLSGGSHTNATGPIHNPWKRGYSAGGSSGGTAVLVATGEADMGIGGDQGGSIRMPASKCGIYGMKPTHGLVPYSGIIPIEQTIDHVGPMTQTVADNALMLEVIAGEDGLDPRQYAPRTYRYTEALGRGCRGLRIGILKQGFDRPESEPDVDAKVRAAAERFASLGAELVDVSLEEHDIAADLWLPITVEGLQDLMMHGNAAGTNYRGLFLPSLTDHVGTWRNRADELSHSLKVCMFLGEYFQTQYRGRFYGKAQNMMRAVTRKYLEVLNGVDLLLMPTMPMKPQPIPPADCSIADYIQRAFEMVGNTAPYNATGLPAMSLPCGLSQGLPIGVMLVSKFYNETVIYQAAHAFEQSGEWRNM
ncbi:MAG: amidase [Rhodobacteraceae bacterium HLUCCA12]|nr:MAG: amidase [Rhodobacteraceae bacterium HLUCCA12]